MGERERECTIYLTRATSQCPGDMHSRAAFMATIKGNKHCSLNLHPKGTLGTFMVTTNGQKRETNVGFKELCLTYRTVSYIIKDGSDREIVEYSIRPFSATNGEVILKGPL